jgi:cob(I)alamin adenosyltransferase
MTRPERQKRLVHVITGNGKGKTCSAVGMAVRALGRGMKVLLIQVLKPEDGSGETLYLKNENRFASFQFGTAAFIDKDRIRAEDLRLVSQGLEAAEKAVRSTEWDMVILDEILLAADLGLVSVERLLRLVVEKSETVELVLTGRNAPAALIEKADLVSEIREIKHPYLNGIHARKGIEF